MKAGESWIEAVEEIPQTKMIPNPLMILQWSKHQFLVKISQAASDEPVSPYMDAITSNVTVYSSLAARIRAQRNAWTAEELAELLSISKKALYGMCRSGRIPHFRVGALIRFDSALIGDWLDSKAA